MWKNCHKKNHKKIVMENNKSYKYFSQIIIDYVT